VIVRNKIFEKILESNKSFCLNPFTTFVSQNGSTTPCCHSMDPVIEINQYNGWSTTQEYLDIRQKMLLGTPVPQCGICYAREKNVGISPRIIDSLKIAREMKLYSIDQIQSIEQPRYYQIRSSNVCNLQCRMCMPLNSNLIEREYIKLGLHDPSIKFRYTGFDIVDLNQVQEVYVAGGEPLVQKEFAEFLQRCIDQKSTNFHLIVNTNAVSVSSRIQQLLSNFSNLHLQFSLDGYQQVNDYIRWPSNWDKVINNINTLSLLANSISFNITVSIYNILNIYKLLKFLDDNYPKPPQTTRVLSLVSSEDDFLSPILFPDKDLVLAMLNKIKNLDSYIAETNVKNIVDILIDYFETKYQLDTIKLDKFFKFNDKLDQARKVQLKDYILELDECRRYVL